MSSEAEGKQKNSEVGDLFNLAKHFIEIPSLVQVGYLTHASPKENMDKIISEKILRAKKHETHSNSPIFGLKGVFFSPENSGGSWTESYFGTKKLCIDPRSLIKKELHNFYFGDFMCFGGNSCHYVTVVVTKSGTAEDEFCQEQNLPKLDINNNPFFILIPPKKEENYELIEYYKRTDRLIVEIMYAHDLDLDEGSIEIKDVKQKPRSSGLHKCTVCKECNAYYNDESGKRIRNPKLPELKGEVAGLSASFSNAKLNG